MFSDGRSMDNQTESNGESQETVAAMISCPTCGRQFLHDESQSLPFCSSRCQVVDLGKWLDEDIGLPHEGDPGEAEVEYLGEGE